MSTEDRPICGKRILVIEDEFLVALSIASILEGHGAIAVGPVGTLCDALKRGGESLDGAVLDLVLGHETSLPVARLLRQRKIPFILMTAHCEEAIPHELDGAPRLPKPFEEGALLKACQSAFA